jgi:hypothetical protein
MLLRVVASTCLAAVILSGCSPKPPDPERTTSTAEDRLKVLCLANARAKTPPADEQAFRKVVEEFGKNNAGMFERFHITSVDEVFTNPRDQQPFGLRFNVRPGVPGSDTEPVAYEATSSGGKRLVAFSSANVVEIDDARFQELVKE